MEEFVTDIAKYLCFRWICSQTSDAKDDQICNWGKM